MGKRLATRRVVGFARRAKASILACKSGCVRHPHTPVLACNSADAERSGHSPSWSLPLPPPRFGDAAARQGCPLRGLFFLYSTVADLGFLVRGSVVYPAARARPHCVGECSYNQQAEI